MSKSTVTSKGQITIPIDVRNKLGIAAGDTLLFQIESDDKLTVYPQRRAPVRSLAGFLKKYARQKPVTLEEMHETIRNRAVTRHLKK